MDECKLTDNQFEQWKLLAAGQPMSTDVKYKNRHDITNCVLYTASNYPITAYLTTADTQEAVRTRTIQYNFHKNTHYFKWEEFWKQFNKQLHNVETGEEYKTSMSESAGEGSQQQQTGYTLPGYKYLGPGNELDLGEPTNELDKIAQERDTVAIPIPSSSSDSHNQPQDRNSGTSYKVPYPLVWD